MPGPWWESRLALLCIGAAAGALVWLPASVALMGAWMGTLDAHLIASAWGLAAFTAALGLVALAVGLRGRVYPRGERCARCGYDVAATLQLAEPVCPECGADLSRKGAVATKRWLPRWRLAAAGATALLIGGAPPAIVRASPSVRVWVDVKLGIQRLAPASSYPWLRPSSSAPYHARWWERHNYPIAPIAIWPTMLCIRPPLRSQSESFPQLYAYWVQPRE